MTTSPEATTETDVAVITDGSVVTDQAALTLVQDEYAVTLKRGLSQYRGMTTVLKACARLRMQARVLIVGSNGHPDWSAKSDAYRLSIEAAEGTVWADSTADEKRRVDGSIRQHIARTYLEPAIVDFALAAFDWSKVDGKTAADLRWTEAKGDTPSILAGEIPALLQKAIAAEYKAAGLTVPVKFGGTKAGTGGGTTPGEPENPAGNLATALEGLDKLAPLVAVSDLHRAISAYVAKVTKGEAVKDRPEVEKVLVKIALQCQTGAKVLAGKSTEKDLEVLAASAWKAE